MISPQPGAYDDPIRFPALLRNQRLCPGKGPKYTLRELMIAEGELDSGDEKIDLNLLYAEMSSVPTAVFVEQSARVEEIRRQLSEIAEIFGAHAERYTVNFSALLDELKRLARFYAKFSRTETAGAEAATAADPADEPDRAAMRVNPGVDLIAAQAKNRSEALLLLRKGCEYFQNAEPTSPVPFLINRALRMAEMNFMDLLAEIDPNAVERGRDILGVKKAEEDS